MGTLSQEILSMTCAYSHSLLPSSHFIVTKPFKASVKRSLAREAERDSTLEKEMVRCYLLREWELALEEGRCGEMNRMERRLVGIKGRLEGMEGGERDEMHGEVSRLLKLVGGVTHAPIARVSTSQKDDVEKVFVLLKGKSNEERSIKSESALDTRNLANRRESEQFVEDALVRGEPVTLFHDAFDAAISQASQSSFKRRRAKVDISDTTSLHSTKSLDLNYSSPSKHWSSRDVTPTPADPHGLRLDSRMDVEEMIFSSSPRKKAALYATPRWPTSGRPSPPPPPPSTPPQLTTSPSYKRSVRGERPLLLTPPSPSPQGILGRKDFGAYAGDDSISVRSIYDELDDDRGKRNEEMDPAEEIWRGIEGEYLPLEGGKKSRWRRLRRQGSIRPSTRER